MSTTVSVIRCERYALPHLRRAARRALEALPGLDRHLRPGRTVMLKPNIVNPRPPERAVCTHPLIVRAIAELVAEAGGRIVVADQPTYCLAGQADHIFAQAGYEDALHGLGVEFRLLGAAGYAPRSPAAPRRWPTIHLAKLLGEADVVINLPKCKTHAQTAYTGAIKNMFGALAPRQRMEMHALGTFDAVSASVADVYAAFVPHLSILDGILAMEGIGPSQGTPRLWGGLLASEDGVALDAVTTSLIGFGTGEVAVTRHAAQAGVGSDVPETIRLVGDDPERLRTRFVRPPRLMRGFPPWLGRIGRRHVWMRPRVSRAACIACGGCARVCPAGAISVGSCAHVDTSACIECFCCMEACPVDAITIRQSLLARLI